MPHIKEKVWVSSNGPVWLDAFSCSCIWSLFGMVKKKNIFMRFIIKIQYMVKRHTYTIIFLFFSASYIVNIFTTIIGYTLLPVPAGCFYKQNFFPVFLKEINSSIESKMKYTRHWTLFYYVMIKPDHSIFISKENKRFWLKSEAQIRLDYWIHCFIGHQ